MKKKAIWLSYDFGLNGPYDDLYYWLDLRDAKECGDSIAFFEYSNTGNLLERLKKDISKNIKLRPKDRIYIIYRQDGLVKGAFLFGRRKAAPWKGIAERQEDAADDA